MSQLLSPFLKARLLTPGPTPSPEWAKLAAASADIYHRSPAFVPYIKRCQMNLARYFGSKQHPIILTSSGTGAMEAAVLNFTDPEDEVLVLVAGKFGERWAQIASTFQCKVHSLKVEWGNTTDLEAILELLKLKPGITKIFLQATETSTGVFHPIDQWLPKLRPLFNGLIIVDAISALLAHPIKMDEWGIDVCLAASQKGFGVAPGLAFVCVAEKAWDKMSKRGAYYFNLKKEREAQSQGTTSWTSATTLIKELDAVLGYLAEFQIEEITNHHRVMASATRAALKAMGLELFVEKNYCYTLTAFCPPPNIESSKLLKTLREKYAATFSGGQDHLKGRIVRISHLGFIDPFEMLAAVAVLECALMDLGHSLEVGKASSVFLASAYEKF